MRLLNFFYIQRIIFNVYILVYINFIKCLHFCLHVYMKNAKGVRKLLKSAGFITDSNKPEEKVVTVFL